MTNKIIEAAREAGQYADAEYQRAWDAGEGASWQQIRDARFYALARAEALEDAAKAVEAQQDLAEQEKADKRFKAALKEGDERNAVDRGDHWMCVSTCNAVLRNAAKAIRALMKETP